MINWLRPPTNLLICVYSSNEVGLELKHFSDFDLKKQDIQGKSIRLDIERHFDQLADLLAHDSEDFMLYCNLIINENYEYNISAGDINTEKDYEKFLNQIDSIVKRIDECFLQSIPFTFSFDIMDFDYDDTPTRYIYQYIKV